MDAMGAPPALRALTAIACGVSFIVERPTHAEAAHHGSEITRISILRGSPKLLSEGAMHMGDIFEGTR